MKKILLSITFLVACANVDINKANREAKEFARNIAGASGVSCNDTDSDHDGYVSCTVFRGEKDPIAISCGAEVRCLFNCASGCRVTPLAYPGK